MIKLNKWFNKLIHGREDPENMLDNAYEDKFRIRTIELKNNQLKYYPEYKLGGIMNGWETIISINNKGVTTTILEYSDLVNSTLHHCDTEKEALILIDSYQKFLINERKLEFKRENILRL